jgi:hypothetical protein
LLVKHISLLVQCRQVASKRARSPVGRVLPLTGVGNADIALVLTPART